MKKIMTIIGKCCIAAPMCLFVIFSVTMIISGSNNSDIIKIAQEIRVLVVFISFISFGFGILYFFGENHQ